MDIGRDDIRSPGARSRGESLGSAVHCRCEGGVLGLGLKPSCLGGSCRLCCGAIGGFDIEVGLRCESRCDNEDIKESTTFKKAMSASSLNIETPTKQILTPVFSHFDQTSSFSAKKSAASRYSTIWHLTGPWGSSDQKVSLSATRRQRPYVGARTISP
jgi:hypothetical protein